MIKNLLLVAAIVAVVAAEDKWSWSATKKESRSAHSANGQRRQERLEDFGDGESTTKKPQQDEFINVNTQRFNYNGIQTGPAGGIGPGGRYPQGPGGNFGPVGPGFGGVGGQFPQQGGFGGAGGQFPQQGGFGGAGGQFPQQGGFGGPAQFPQQSGFGGQFPQQNGFGRPQIGGQGQFGPVGGYGSPSGIGGYGSPSGIGGGYFPGGGQGNNGVLVGPGGPTGVIGRPNGYQSNRGQPAVLVGPGGPTGIVGRPPGGGYGLLPNGYGAYGQGGYGGLNAGSNSIDIGINTVYGGQQGGFGGGRPGGFGGPIGGGFGGPGGPGGPGGFGGIPYNRGGNPIAFDEPENSSSQSKKEGKDSH